MSKIVIKKHVSLDFLGEEYKGAELVFRAIPLSDYDDLMENMPVGDPALQELSQKAKDGKLSQHEQAKLKELMRTSSETNKQSVHMIVKYLKKYFLSGKFPNEEGELQDVSADDIDGLDQESAVKCFEQLTGQLTSPKE
jgi:hypothetical protein